MGMVTIRRPSAPRSVFSSQPPSNSGFPSPSYSPAPRTYTFGPTSGLAQMEQVARQPQSPVPVSAENPEAARQAEARRLLQELTARRLNLLRQGLMGQQGRNVSLLRQQLAQRGMLDSGDLAARLGRIGSETSGLMAQGTQMAANQEAEGLLDLLRGSQERQFGREQQERQIRAAIDMARLQAKQAKDSSPSGLDFLLGGLGTAVGGPLGGILGKGLGSLLGL